ncbi:MAG TPA: beta-propeller fold lactonase family protein [Steroidobacteraceae bacterium]
MPNRYVFLVAALALAGCNVSPHFSLTTPTYSVGGTISGLSGSGLQLTNAGGAFFIAAGANGLYPNLVGSYPAGTNYDLTVLTQPGNPSQTCVVANGMGTVGNANSAAITVTCTTNTSRFLYVASQPPALAGEVEPFSIDAGTGALSAVPGAAQPVPGTPEVVASTPSGQYAYVLTVGGPVYGYSIGNAGALTALAGSPYPTANQSNGMSIDPSGTYLYVANSTDNAVFAFAVGSTGALTAIAGSPFAAGSSPLGVGTAITSNGVRLVFVTNGGANNVSAYLADASTGVLTPVAGSPFAAGGDPNSIAVDASAQFAFVTNASDNTVSVYAIDSSSGALAAVNGSPFATGTGPVAVAPDPSAPYVYVANFIDGTVSAYQLNVQNGDLTVVPGSPFPAGSKPFSAQVDNLGHFLYVANFGSGNLSAYAIGGNGALTALATSPFPVGGVNSGPVSLGIAN